MTAPSHAGTARLLIGLLFLPVFVVMAASPGLAAGGGKRLNLERYCKSIKMDYLGLYQPGPHKKRRHACGIRKVGFNRIYVARISYIDLSRVCRRYHKTTKWHYEGDKVWCLPPDPVTTLRLCNRSRETVWAGISYWAGKPRRRRIGRPSGWVSEGWWKIGPGGCRQPRLSAAYDGDVYIYGYSQNVDYEGTAARFCINRGGKFTFGEADSIACNGPGLKKVGMHKFRVRRRTNTWNFR